MTTSSPSRVSSAALSGGRRRCGWAPTPRWFSSGSRGQPIERDDLIAALQGQHVHSGEQLRRPGALKREARDERGRTLLDDDGRRVVERVSGVAHVEMTMSVPKSVSVLWAMADQTDRQRIEDALLVAAERTVQYMVRNKAVVHRRGKDGVRVREPAAGAAVASSLHVTARRARGDRAPAPQLDVHNLVVGVVRMDGRLVAADSWEWFRHDAALEGGALFRAQVADALVNAGWAIRSGPVTGGATSRCGASRPGCAR